MGQPEIQHQYTAEEYFALEAHSEVRHEFFDGEVFAMAGGTKSHNLIGVADGRGAGVVSAQRGR